HVSRHRLVHITQVAPEPFRPSPSAFGTPSLKEDILVFSPFGNASQSVLVATRQVADDEFLLGRGSSIKVANFGGHQQFPVFRAALSTAHPALPPGPHPSSKTGAVPKRPSGSGALQQTVCR